MLHICMEFKWLGANSAKLQRHVMPNFGKTMKILNIVLLLGYFRHGTTSVAKIHVYMYTYIHIYMKLNCFGAYYT